MIRKALSAIRTGVKAFAMRWAGQARYWWDMLLPRTTFDYGAEVGDGSRSNIVVACVHWMARSFPEAPVIVVREHEDGTREILHNHPLPKLIERPNPYYSGVLLWMATITDWQMSGNAYWVKVRETRTNSIIELWWVPSWMMEPKWPPDGNTFISHYEYKSDPARDALQLKPEDVVHFRYGLDPLNARKGLSPLRSLLREIFTDDEAANMTAALMRNLGIPGVVLAPEGADAQVSEESATEIKEAFRSKFSGDRRGEPMVMTTPTKISVLSFSPEQMLLRELRRVPEERVSAVLGVPAIVAGLGAGLDRSTYTNYAEARSAAWEQAIIPAQRLKAADLETQLLPDFGKTEGLDVDFDLSRVRALQPDMDNVYKRMGAAVREGWATLADARRAVNLPVRPEHDIYLRMVTIVEVPAKQAKSVPPAPISLKAARETVVAARRRLAELHKPMFEEAAARIVRRERVAIMEAAERLLRPKARKAQSSFEEAIDELYADPAFVQAEMSPVLAAYAEAVQDVAAREVGAKPGMTPEMTIFLAAYGASLATRWAGSSRGQVLSIAGIALREGADPLGALGLRMDEWEERRPGKVAAWETIQSGNAIAKETYKLAGVQRLVWAASGDSCPYCQKLNGKTVEITRTFLSAGDSLEAEGADVPLTRTVDLGHPPAHEGCACTVMSA